MKKQDEDIAMMIDVPAVRRDYAKGGPQSVLTVKMVKQFGEICQPGMELKAEYTRIEGFGSMGSVCFGREETRIVRLRVEKKYRYGTLMSDRHFHSWEELAILNMKL
ncbi:MAG: hypothetical protein II553_04760 [Lachnospiraceae bacterium]|nr:hypothetical protein [Lachnospiraceae bacterium]